MTVAELQDLLDEFNPDLPVVLEVAGVGRDDRTDIHEVLKAIYEGAEEIHIIATNGAQRNG